MAVTNEEKKALVNQCDGCARELPVKQLIHVEGDGTPYMCCCKGKYKGESCLGVQKSYGKP